MSSVKLGVGRRYFAFDDVQVAPINKGNDRFLLDVRKHVTREEYIDLLEAVSMVLDLSKFTMELKVGSQVFRFVGCQVTPRKRDSDHYYVDVRSDIDSWRYKVALGALIDANTPASTTGG